MALRFDRTLDPPICLAAVHVVCQDIFVLSGQEPAEQEASACLAFGGCVTLPVMTTDGAAGTTVSPTAAAAAQLQPRRLSLASAETVPEGGTNACAEDTAQAGSLASPTGSEPGPSIGHLLGCTDGTVKFRCSTCKPVQCTEPGLISPPACVCTDWRVYTTPALRIIACLQAANVTQPMLASTSALSTSCPVPGLGKAGHGQATQAVGLIAAQHGSPPSGRERHRRAPAGQPGTPQTPPSAAKSSASGTSDAPCKDPGHRASSRTESQLLMQHTLHSNAGMLRYR